jgi:sulfite exporter TauE/SafE
MQLAFIIGGLSLGLVSSLHCLGMCGPLSLTVSASGSGRWSQIRSGLLYHSGRILTYACFGLVFGLAGRRIYLAGFQQIFSVGAGLGIIGYLLLQHVFGKSFIVPAKPLRFVQGWILALWKKPGRFRFFFMGIGNGLLPCGMVYLAAAVALGSPDIIAGVMFMIAFGLGTLPTLLALRMAMNKIGVSTRIRLRRVFPYLVGIIAVLLVLRGLNLGIPLISPVMARVPTAAVHCH